MFSSKNFRLIARSRTPIELITPGTITPGSTPPAALDGPHSPVSAQAMANQAQTATGVQQVIAGLQSLNLDGSVQGNVITIRHTAAASSSSSSSMFATLGEGQGSNLMALS